MNTEMFPNMPLSARLFVYTSDKTLDFSEYSDFSQNMQEFIDNWKAHGTMLDASFMIIANRVLIIVVDEKEQIATGCSIDSLNRHLQSSEFYWFSRHWVLHTSNQPSVFGDWTVSDLHDFHEKCRSGLLSRDEYILNTTVLTVEEMRKELVQKVSESWHNKML